MNDLDRDRIKHAANTNAVRRMLIQYFVERGFSESFDRAVNPLQIQDMPFTVTGLDTKIEIEPHAVEIDPTTSLATLGWNLFVLGNRRLYLGETTHENLLDLARQIKAGQINFENILSTRRCTTPRRIIVFLERVLSDADGGYVDLTPRQRAITQRPRAYRPVGAPSQEAQFYSRSGYGT